MMNKCRFALPFILKYSSKMMSSRHTRCCAKHPVRKFSSSAHLKQNFVITKLNPEELEPFFTPELKLLSELFKRNDYELRIVGGAVRDFLSGIRPHDLDFATTATPDQMVDMFQKEGIRILHTRGAKHGTIAIRVNDMENFEITTLRTDVSTDGRHAEVAFTTDWGVDATRRDLTINALYLDLEGNVYDYVGGREDLENRRVLFVGDPNKRIQEDYLRILRYFRFYGRIATTPDAYDEETIESIKKNAPGLYKISGERIWSEFHRILSENFVKENVKKMLEVGLGPYMGLGDPNELDMKWFEEVCELNKKYCFRPITYVTALLGSNEKVLNFHARVKLPNFDRDLSRYLIAYKTDDLTEPAKNPLRPFQAMLLNKKLLHMPIRDFTIEVLSTKDREDLIEKLENWEMPPPMPVNGTFLKAKYGIKADKLGPVMNVLRDLWIESDFTLTQEELLAQMSELARYMKESN